MIIIQLGADEELQIKAKEIENKFAIEMAKIQSQEKIAGLDNLTKVEIEDIKQHSSHQLAAADYLNEGISTGSPTLMKNLAKA